MKTLIFILQIVCILITAFGIYVEFTFEAHIGFLLISVGSLTFAVTTKLMKISLKRYIRKLLNEKDSTNESSCLGSS